MRKFYLLTALIFFCLDSFSQNFSYACPRDTLVGCGNNCFNLKARFPDVRALGSDYSYENATNSLTCAPYVPPGGPGPSANLVIDDKFSTVIPLPFTFYFYGLPYNSVIVSTNGYISFDVSKANAFSHYGILNSGGFLGATSGTPQNLPSALYDRAIIMGPYHDLDPAINTSPSRQIKYEVFGTAPNRKWILSTYKVPLFSCTSLINNTSQIVLYESTGVVEVIISDKDICTAWNQGRSMIGMQDFTRLNGIMAPGRQASDAPWGSANMNEKWRFIPTQGAVTYRSVQLLNSTGTVIATGDTTRINSSFFETTFLNICPAAGNLLVVKTTYATVNDPAVTVYSLDTINVVRSAFPVTATSTGTSCGATTGSITVTASGGTAPLSYSLNGAAGQASNVFNNLAGGTYTITVTDATGCLNTVTATVTPGTTLTGTIAGTATSCTTATNGTITVTPTSGTAPYSYRLNGGAAQPGNTFTGLAPGTYSVSFTDVSGCSNTLSFTVTAGSNITGTNTKTDASCPGVNNGTITITPTTGTAPYQYRLNAGASQASRTFNNLAPGTYSVTATDANGCSFTLSNITIGQGTPLTATTTNNNPPCNNINNGSITISPTTGTAPYSYSLNGGTAQLSGTFNNLAPGSYTFSFTDANGCTGGGTTTLTTNSPVTITAVLVQPLCKGSSNGSITLTGAGGVSPYNYSKNAGVTYQASGTFGSLAAGTYTFRVKDNAGCTKDTTLTLSEPTLLTASSTSTPSSCNGNDGTITVVGTGGTQAYTYSVDNGATYQPGSGFTVAPGNYNNIKVKDANGCIANTSVTVTLVDNMFLNAGNDTTICMESSLTFQPQTNPETNIFLWRPAATIKDPTLKNAIATPLDTTRFILHATWGACQREDTLLINVLHKPVADAGKDTIICFQTFAFLRGNATNLSGTVNYSWAPASDISNPDQQTTTVFPKGAGLFPYTLTVKDTYGCNYSETDVVNITVNVPPPAYAGNDTLATLGVPHQLYGSGGKQYLWSPASPLNSAFNQNPVATLYKDTRFILQVTDNGGCIGYDTVFVKVYEGPAYYIPNAFTPNGDGLNDIFRPIPVGITRTEWFRIFNRYGELVFETNQWLKGWDGRHLGKNALQGTYIWMIKGVDKNGKVIEKKGTVILVR
ncbi:MAG: gliding motility-associated C-terminal domain-containing protein [Ferruginibacter sp.]